MARKNQESSVFHAQLIAIHDHTKLAHLQGENAKPHRIIELLLDDISEEEFGRFLFADKVKISF